MIALTHNNNKIVINDRSHYYPIQVCIDRHNWSARVPAFDGQLSPANDRYLVPNIVHYILFETHFINYVHFLSILSVLKNQKPDSLYIHCDCHELRGDYWQRINRVVNATNTTRLIVREIQRPTHIFGQQLSKSFHNYHASDIGRIQVLREFGGIYLDRDVYVVKSLDTYRNYEMTLDYEIRDWGLNTEYKVLGTQTLVAHRKARFLKLWLICYCDYHPWDWYYNAGELPTKEILAKRPDLIHDANGQFAADGRRVCPSLYNRWRSDWRQTYYTVHLNIRDNLLSPSGWCLEGQRPPISQFDEYNVRQLNTTFAEMATNVLDYEISVKKQTNK
ncbi:uncharacterized protein LOC128957301 [Oppia nitens]|uniref:uncharacterized protein LOC128957301 n=1 Tax=Oppia nitens TaxID=1686743 RepID=UPI0023DC9A7F|nr:uncharacterized protein LOC128957301 [Oppia nitens]